MSARFRAAFRAKDNKDSLLRTEATLERITNDLQLPMLIDIGVTARKIVEQERGDGLDENTLRQAVQEAINKALDTRSIGNQSSVRDVVEANLSRGGFGGAGGTIFRLGSVRFDMLEEGEDILGAGTFGIVRPGMYMGEEVAVKSAIGPVFDPEVLSELR